MGSTDPKSIERNLVEQIIGHLNYSSGVEDSGLAANLDLLFRKAGRTRDSDRAVADVVFDRLKSGIERATKSGSNGLRHVDQARSVVALTSEHLFPAWLAHHRDLLFHQDRNFLFNSFFTARAFQAVLQAEGPWDETDRIVHFAISRLNDYLGHRPVAVLESQNIEPFPHEWIAPIPVYLRGTGCAAGRYLPLIEIALETISETGPDILREAFFSMDRLRELAIDPRAFDFDHPINKRPNHHFGQWDEHSIDDSGYYQRFILHQVTLDALLGRVDRDQQSNSKLSRRELLVEAGSVLACTMLMASGICGHGPGAFDSNTTLADLLPTIAGYRDSFYDELIQRLPAKHRNRLIREAKSRGQPFGGARQDLNSELDRRRASQFVNCRLSSIFARMGFSDAAVAQSLIVPVASARILCQIDCLLSRAKLETQRRKLASAYSIIPRVFQLLRQGVDCGAIVDPWNILGFDGQYSLFAATENSIPDHRVYDLVDLVERILGMCSSIWSEAAAVDDLETCVAIRREFSAIVDWWRQFAAHEVMSVDAVDPQEIFDAAALVSKALNLWHKGGAAAGDIEFWKQHAALFDAPKAYQLVIEALMDRGDYQTSSALLVHWLSQSASVRLQHGDSSFHNLIWRWISEQKALLKTSDTQVRSDIWNRIRRFHDFLEANADSYGQVPQFGLGRPVPPDRGDETGPNINPDFRPDPDSDSETDLFHAAYEGVVYSDSTDDGFDGSIFEFGENGDDELEAEVDRVHDRLDFLATIADFWWIAATFPLPVNQGGLSLDEPASRQLGNRRDILVGWIDHANRNRTKLATLLESVARYPIPGSGIDPESMMQYDRKRLFKDSLLNRIVATSVETELAVTMLAAVISAIDHLVEKKPLADPPAVAQHKAPLVSLFAAILITDLHQVKLLLPAATAYLGSKPLLYVPTSRGGAGEIVSVRVLQEEMRDLAASLPVLGLYYETHLLMKTALAMEANHGEGQGAVTEFDDLFQVAYGSMMKCLIQAAQQFQQVLELSGEFSQSEANDQIADVLFECVQLITDPMQDLWLTHSKTLRLSVLEKVADENSWERLVKFIQVFGGGLFTQQFLQLSNIRAILHQSVGVWLENVRNSPVPVNLRLIDELDRSISKSAAAGCLTLILEAVCENYNEYRDYNTTTTQSDRGELLFNLLDFLRLKGHYDRISWFLKPIVWGHEILVRNGQGSVARMWRRSLTERLRSEADRYVNQLQDLRGKYSMQMGSVGRHVEGRFVHPMQIDRLCAKVATAMANPDSKKSKRAFDMLQQDTRAFAKATAGVGVDLPAWLAALENEVQQHHLPLRLRTQNRDEALIHPINVSISCIREELAKLPRTEL